MCRIFFMMVMTVLLFFGMTGRRGRGSNDRGGKKDDQSQDDKHDGLQAATA
jgi:hypothetical protein